MSKPKKLTERQRFEAWYRRAYGWCATPHAKGGYYERSADDAWQGWNASARAKR